MADPPDTASPSGAERFEAAGAEGAPRLRSSVTSEKIIVVNAEVSAGLEERLAQVDIGDELAAEGITTVALDSDGNLVEHRPNGTTTVLGTL